MRTGKEQFLLATGTGPVSLEISAGKVASNGSGWVQGQRVTAGATITGDWGLVLVRYSYHSCPHEWGDPKPSHSMTERKIRRCIHCRCAFRKEKDGQRCRARQEKQGGTG